MEKEKSTFEDGGFKKDFRVDRMDAAALCYALNQFESIGREPECILIPRNLWDGLAKSVNDALFPEEVRLIWEGIMKDRELVGTPIRVQREEGNSIKVSGNGVDDLKLEIRLVIEDQSS